MFNIYKCIISLHPSFNYYIVFFSHKYLPDHLFKLIKWVKKLSTLIKKKDY